MYKHLLCSLEKSVTSVLTLPSGPGKCLCMEKSCLSPVIKGNRKVNIFFILHQKMISRSVGSCKHFIGHMKRKLIMIIDKWRDGIA